jgi:hypothetical protein
MNKKRYDKAFTHFLGRDVEKITPKTFFEVLAQTEPERIQQTIEVQAKMVDGKVHFLPTPALSVHENEIVVGNQRIVIRLS